MNSTKVKRAAGDRPKYKAWFGFYLLTQILLAHSNSQASSNVSKAPKNETGQGVYMSSSSIVPMKYGSPTQNFSLAAKTNAKGKVTWSKELELTGQNMYNAHILQMQNLQLLVTSTAIHAIDADGSLVWTRKIKFNSFVAIGSKGAFYQNSSRLLEAVDSKNDLTLKSAPFPGGLGSHDSVDLFWPREKDFIAVIAQGTASGGDDAGRPHRLKPNSMLVQNQFPTTYGDWLHPFEGELVLPSLYFPESEILSIGSNSIYRFSLSKKVELSHFAWPIQEPLNWSASPKEIYHILGYDKKVKVLVLVDSKGQELWRWKDPAPSEPPTNSTDSKDLTGLKDLWVNNPPLLGENGMIFAFTENRVLAFKDKKINWEFKASDSEYHFRAGAVLADSSLLVVCGKTLFHLDSSGKKLFSLTLDQEIVTAPIVNQSGSIFISTMTKMVRID